MLETEKGDNWSVMVFICPIDRLTDVLPALWDVFEQNRKISLIPHYTIRDTIRNLVNRPQSVVISWRVLRVKKNSSKIINV